MKKYNTKRAAALFVTSVLVATTVLSGCGKKSVDYLDENGKGGKSEGGTLTARLGIPESADTDIEVGESGLKSIKLEDADIIVPDKDSMSVVYYKSNEMDNTYKKTVAEALFDKSSGIYLHDWEKPYKGDIEAEIELYQQLVESATTSGDNESVEYYNEYIASLRDSLTTASEEREGAGDYSGEEFIGNVGKNQFMLSFMVSYDGLGSYFDYSLYPSSSIINYRPHDGAAVAYYYEGEYMDSEDQDGMEDSTNKCSLTEEEAVQMATDFLGKCGIDDVIYTSVTDLTWEYDDSLYNIVALENNGYVVNFKRSIDGVAPYTGTTYMLEYLWEEDVFYDSVNETYSISVDDNGILAATCYDFLRPTGEKTENVELMSWDKVQESLAAAVSTFYKENKTSYDTITFNDIRLTYYKVPDGENFKYIPVWIFAECDKVEGGLDEDYPIQLIILDAVSGEMIDLKDVLISESYDTDDYYEDGDDGSFDMEFDEGDVEIDDSDIELDEGDIEIDDSDIELDDSDIDVDDEM